MLMFLSEAVTQRCSVKKEFLEISQNSQENTCARVKVAALRPEACNVIKKETLAQVFSCEFCQMSKNTFFYRTHPVAASVLLWIVPDSSFLSSSSSRLTDRMFTSESNVYHKLLILQEIGNES